MMPEVLQKLQLQPEKQFRIRMMRATTYRIQGDGSIVLINK